MDSAASATAIPTYTGSSFSHSALRSVTSADMPDTKQSLLHTLLISLIACIVTSADVELSKKTASIVQSPLLKRSYTLSGNISIGTSTSMNESYQRTVSTWSTALILSASSLTALLSIPSTTTKQNAPFPKSSMRMSCPLTVSMSFGRYVSIS